MDDRELEATQPTEEEQEQLYRDQAEYDYLMQYQP
jgi:hypothetical protein